VNGTPPPLPTTFADGTIVYKQVKESDIGRDLNEDLDMNDVVTLVDGDSDGDGVFDSGDVCTETSNPNQLDTDGDLLPDACDPNPYCGNVAPAAPLAPPANAEACQKSVAKAALKLLATEEKATRGCLDKIAKGALVGEPTALCRGGVVNGVATLPGDASTASKIRKAVQKVAAAAGKCDPLALSQIGTCANIPGCVAVAAARSTVVVSSLAYGAVSAIADKTTLGCQKTIGAASGQYLAALTKAMSRCVNAVNAGDLTGPADTVCLGSETSGGYVPPTDPDTAAKIAKAGETLGATLDKACPATTAAPLDACGDDPAHLATCVTCAHAREAVAIMRAAYGPP
jgi:hypothetical protein